MKNILLELAVESGAMEPEVENHPLDETVGDLIEQDHRSEGPSDMLSHASKARDIADQLDELADRADELADEDERYTGLSVESLGREFNTLMTVSDLSFKAHSFESAVGSKSRRAGISFDARRTADDLRANADIMASFSTESGLMDMFRDRATALKKAQLSLNTNGSALKAHVDFLKNDGVVVKHDGIAMFLTQNATEVLDMKQGIDSDINYLGDVEKYISERLSYLSSLSGTADTSIKLGDEKSVNTIESFLKATGTTGFNLMGNKGVYNFTILDGGGRFGQFKKAKSWAKMAAAMAVGGGVMPRIGVGLIPVIGYSGALALTMIGGAAAGMAAGKSIIEQSDLKSVLSANNIQATINDIMALSKYAKMESTVADIERVEGSLRTSLKPVNKPLFKEAVKELDKVKKCITILQNHSFYLTSQTARVFEYTVKHIKK